MPWEQIREGFDVFVHDGDKAIGAVREVTPGGRSEFVMYVENAGDFSVPLEAIVDVEAEKVTVNFDRLDPKLKQAIGHAHDREDPRL
jgi:hypothetical protein